MDGRSRRKVERCGPGWPRVESRAISGVHPPSPRLPSRPVSTRVVVVGSYMQDLAFYAERFPQSGETVVGEFRSGSGGKGFNQAVAAARAGAATRFIGAVGRDAFGSAAKKFASRIGLRATFVAKARHPTGTAVVTINAAGQNQIVIAPGANLALHRLDLPATVLSGAQVVVCQGESDYRTVAHVLKVARRSGATTVLNPAPMRPDFDLGLLRLTDVLVPNETEFLALVRLHPGCAALLREGTGFDAKALHTLEPAALQRLCRRLEVPVVILTLGARGCFVSEPDTWKRMQAHPVEVVDTTGAGDAFVGGFAAGLVKFKGQVGEAAHFANAVAALAVMQPGTAEAMPHAREIARFLRARAHAVR